MFPKPYSIYLTGTIVASRDARDQAFGAVLLDLCTFRRPSQPHAGNPLPKAGAGTKLFRYLLTETPTMYAYDATCGCARQYQ